MRLPHRKWLVASAIVVVRGLLAGRATAGPVPSGFQPGDFTATGDLDWWVLGTTHCGRAQCLALARTTDGGRTFTAVPTPPSSTAEQATVGQLRFANARDGYAFGPELWSTHDGGRTWRQVPIGYASELAAADGYAYAVVSGRGPSELMRSPVGRDRWKVLPTRGVLIPSSLEVHGKTVIVETQRRALISDDWGAHFRLGGRLPVGMGCKFDTAAGTPVLWALCFRAAANPGGDLLRSSNAGGSWSRATTSGTQNQPIEYFAAAAADTWVIAGYQGLYRTTNGGTTWSQASGLPTGFSAFYLGFTDPTHGVAIGGYGSGRHWRIRLYGTSDGGASYHLIPIGRS